MIDLHGHWIAIRQAVPGRVCACINPVTKDAHPECNSCLGSGRAFIDRFAKARKSRPVKLTQASMGGERRSPVMEAGANDWTFYIEHNMKPTTEDFIIELRLDEQTLEPIVPYAAISIYNITDSRDLRDKNGRTEYYAVTAEKQPWPYFEITE